MEASRSSAIVSEVPLSQERHLQRKEQRLSRDPKVRDVEPDKRQSILKSGSIKTFATRPLSSEISFVR